MPRWEPGAADRLQNAALELFAEQGFHATTVDEIAGRAGVTRRTFHRHFADKREVLFAGEDLLPERVEAMVKDAPVAATLFELVERGFVGLAAELFDGRRDEIRLRAKIIDSDPGLRERDLHKLELIRDLLLAAFRDRGAAELDAEVAATIAVSVFRVSLRRWIASDNDRSYSDTAQETLDRIRDLAAQ